MTAAGCVGRVGGSSGRVWRMWVHMAQKRLADRDAQQLTAFCVPALCHSFPLGWCMVPRPLLQVINFWTGAVEYTEDGGALNEPNPPTIDEARAAFPDCSFIGA